MSMLKKLIDTPPGENLGEVVDARGRTLAWHAAKNDHVSVLELLLELYGPKTLLQADDRRITPAIVACQNSISLYTKGCMPLFAKLYGVEDVGRCKVCSKEGSGKELKKCSGCHCVRYCDAKCQKEHWKAHKEDCDSCKYLEKSRRTFEQIPNIGLNIVHDGKYILVSRTVDPDGTIYQQFMVKQVIGDW